MQDDILVLNPVCMPDHVELVRVDIPPHVHRTDKSVEVCWLGERAHWDLLALFEMHSRAGTSRNRVSDTSQPRPTPEVAPGD